MYFEVYLDIILYLYLLNSVSPVGNAQHVLIHFYLSMSQHALRISLVIVDTLRVHEKHHSGTKRIFVKDHCCPIYPTTCVETRETRCILIENISKSIYFGTIVQVVQWLLTNRNAFEIKVRKYVMVWCSDCKKTVLNTHFFDDYTLTKKQMYGLSDPSENSR